MQEEELTAGLRPTESAVCYRAVRGESECSQCDRPPVPRATANCHTVTPPLSSALVAAAASLPLLTVRALLFIAPGRTGAGRTDGQYLCGRALGRGYHAACLV